MNGDSHLGGKLHLTEIIDYDRDIDPHRFISIVAGVGSGKTTFIDNLIKGNVLKHQDGTPVKRQAILLIESRRSKVDEQLRSKNAFYASKAYNDSFRIWYANDEEARVYEENFERIKVGDPSSIYSTEVFKHSVAHTNARIETNLKWSYTPEDPLARPWERFDMIVVDEVHSLITDASYQSAPFYVMRLIEETLKRSETCKVITMTGTAKVLNKHPLFAQAHVVDRMDACVNITPKSVEFITAQEAAQLQRTMLDLDEKFVAFYNHIDPILELNKEEPDKTVMSFSAEDRLGVLSADTLKRIKNVQEHMAEKSLLPNDVIGFLTTSRNKEGISINNEDIHAMFIEAHTEADIIQMAGRLRNPVDVLYVVVDSNGYWDPESRFEKKLSMNKFVLGGINDEFKALCAEEGYSLQENDDDLRDPVYQHKTLREYIDYIHVEYPYVRFDYFSNRFVYYEQREISKRYDREQNRIFDRAKCWSCDLIALARTWFPKAKCSVSCAALSHEEKQAYVDAYLCENDWLGGKRDIRQAERIEILMAINWITGERAKNLGSVLKRYDFDLVKKTRSKKTDAPYKIVRTPVAVEEAV